MADAAAADEWAQMFLECGRRVMRSDDDARDAGHARHTARITTGRKQASSGWLLITSWTFSREATRRHADFVEQ